ncbi:Serine-threonine kinase receptor-associated protein [Penicillium hispanicum]|uniref:Serine-threonine kinase receptor-associated protein n=1 Tax=Penicillium hispanicum TaxID=1080232 RepID=UPI002541318A|nr:Serine-threonine kinase receptor-associated protein [Penicillium hispanicum]KAJ5573904.1 Serine-threonine kinase receptor-associated protein [Penicillium hispanicum]
MAADIPKVVPLTCHGHSRPVTHLSFSSTVEEDQYYLISACKDNNPMLRDGITGDWIGTFLGHKGAVWQARLSADAAIAATAAADFSAAGNCIPHPDQPPSPSNRRSREKLRIFDLSRSTGTGDGSNGSSPPLSASGGGNPSQPGSDAVTSYEIGPGVHGGTIKSIVWNQDYNIVTTAAEDRKIRWWDLRSRHPVLEYSVDGTIGTCELNSLAVRPNDPGILTVAAGKSVYLFDGLRPGQLLKKADFGYEVASAAVNSDSGRLVTGSANDTWARVYDLQTDEELEVQKGHHGPIWSVSFSPDGRLYGTGSEDGTIKLWKACREPYGLWR